jgi:hypothetical protein
MARRGVLDTWIRSDRTGNIRSPHPALLAVVATTPYTELVDLSETEFRQAVERAAEGLA